MKKKNSPSNKKGSVEYQQHKKCDCINTADLSSSGLLIIDKSPGLKKQNRVLSINTTLSSITGLSLSALKKLTTEEILGLILPADAIESYLQPTLLTQEHGYILTRPEQKTSRHLHIKSVPLSENQLGIIVDDVTTQAMFEKALHCSEQRFSTIFKYSPIAVMSLSLNKELNQYIVTDINNEFERLFGVNKISVIGKTPVMLGMWLQIPQEIINTTNPKNNSEVTFETAINSSYGTVIGVVTAKYISDNTGQYFLIFIKDITSHRFTESELSKLNNILLKTVEESFELMGRLLESRDPYTQGHQERTAEIAAEIARTIGISEEDTKTLFTAALVHDIGKIQVPAELLARPGGLTDLEYRLVQAHAYEGHRILSSASFAKKMSELVLLHHERIDGSGYPFGIGNSEVCPLVRILGVSDALEAMASHRPYRPSLGIERALFELDNSKRYDPDVVSACKDLYKNGTLYNILTTEHYSITGVFRPDQRV